jgi:hypothetical protein
VLQGLFGAMLQPTAPGLLRAAFPAQRLNMAIGVWGACIAASTVSFIDGMHLAFAVSAGVAFAAALLSLLVRAGRQVEAAA